MPRTPAARMVPTPVAVRTVLWSPVSWLAWVVVSWAAVCCGCWAWAAAATRCGCSVSAWGGVGVVAGAGGVTGGVAGAAGATGGVLTVVPGRVMVHPGLIWSASVRCWPSGWTVAWLASASSVYRLGSPRWSRAMLDRVSPAWTVTVLPASAGAA